MNDFNDLQLALNSHFPIVVVETHEEHRVLDLLSRALAEGARALVKWTVTDGLMAVPGVGEHPTGNFQDLRLEGEAPSPVQSTTDPQQALRRMRAANAPTVFALLDFHHYLEAPVTIRLLKEIAQGQHVNQHTVVLISHRLNLPEELSRSCARFELSMPDEAGIYALLRAESQVWGLQNDGAKVKADRKAMTLLAKNLLGLTVTDAKRLIRNAIHDDGAITHADIPDLQKAKYELIGQDGLLSFEYETARFSDVGGLHNLKQWLEKRGSYFVRSQDDSALDRPKGILLVGVQGGGKSLAAKAVAGVWGVPLLRLDFGVMYNKFFGETEKNMREALKLAQIMSPCVLWIDEIEKGIATGDYDSGTSRRVLGTLLTWMAENSARTFIVATANDIQALPPELIRKGRLDEIFFVDLPDDAVRRDIFAIHLNKRGHRPDAFDLVRLSAQSPGFSGAEIEQAVVAAAYSAHAANASMSDEHIVAELDRTKPLSVVMSERVTSLRQWAEHRTVPAN